jgi:hypothetical protein
MPKTESTENGLTFCRTFSSLPLRYAAFPYGKPYDDEEEKDLPFLLRNGLQTKIYIIDSIQRIATDSQAPDGADPAWEASNPSTGSNVPTQGVYGRRLWKQQRSTKPSYVLKSLCQALFAALYLTAEVNTQRGFRDFKDTTLADIMANMINLPGSRAEPNRPPLPHPYFSK